MLHGKCRKVHRDKFTVTPAVKIESVDDDEYSCPDFVPYKDHKTSSRSMPPQKVINEIGNYLGLDNIADQMIGMDVVLDEVALG